MKSIMKFAMVMVLAFAFASTAAAQNYNTKYGETTWSKLPTRGMLSKNIWVGSWWSYKANGIGFRQNATGDMKNGKDNPAGWGVAERVDELSPVEKYDLFVGNADKIEREKIVGYLEKIGETESSITSKIEERRDLIRKLNAAIEENREDADFDWKETDDGKKYLEITKEIEEAEAGLADGKPTIDTATEAEIWSHGTAQYGVQHWWGHCNAWAAAAIMEPEPRFSTTVENADGTQVTFTAGDVKALITEVYMELSSSFYGTRNDYHKDEASREKINYKDVTPAAFHIFFADQIGNKDRSFVIDRYTGDQVWNQPVKAYRSTVTVLNDGASVRKNVVVTKYPNWGNPNVAELGEQDVWEVSITTTMHWITDGVPHEKLTVTNIDDSISDADFANSNAVGSRWDHQVEIRTLSYTLWLDKSPDDPEAQVVGDGEWNHGSTWSYDQLHPDFMWQPQANVNNSRDYENEYVDYQVLLNDILPGSIKPADDPTVEPAGDFVANGPIDIPDADADTGVEIPIEVTGSVDEITEMTVAVKITHTYKGDLKISLLGPDGRQANLKKFGSGGADDNVDRTWDVKKFQGSSANGTWTLKVWDQWSDDTGTVDTVKLAFK